MAIVGLVQGLAIQLRVIRPPLAADARRPSERVDDKAGVVRQSRHAAAGNEEVTCLGRRVFLERLEPLDGIFRGSYRDAGFTETEDANREMPQKRNDLAHFILAPRCDQ